MPWAVNYGNYSYNLTSYYKEWTLYIHICIIVFCSFLFSLSNLLRLVLTEEFIDDGLKENSKQRKRKAEKKDMRARIVPLIVRRKFRPRVKTCYPNFFLHKIIIEPSYMINELVNAVSDFFQLYILLLDLSFKISNQEQALRKNGI